VRTPVPGGSRTDQSGPPIRSLSGAKARKDTAPAAGSLVRSVPSIDQRTRRPPWTSTFPRASLVVPCSSAWGPEPPSHGRPRSSRASGHPHSRRERRYANRAAPRASSGCPVGRVAHASGYQSTASARTQVSVNRTSRSAGRIRTATCGVANRVGDALHADSSQNAWRHRVGAHVGAAHAAFHGARESASFDLHGRQL